MNQSELTDQARDEAVDWFVRLEQCDDEILWHHHLEWLESDPLNGEAYAEVEAFSVALDDAVAHGDAPPARQPRLAIVARTNHPHTHSRARIRDRPRSRWRSAWVPTAAAASISAVMAIPYVQDALQSGQTYRTDATHIREIALADGSRLTLNRNTRVTVLLRRATRSATLESGEAAFDIHHDNSRPFMVAVGSRTIRVLGTEFNVLHQNGAFAVTVRRGLVAVSTEGGLDQAVRLTAGLALTENARGRDEQVSAVRPDNAFAWRAGRLVYADTPIADVARDLARYSGLPYSVASTLREVRVTAVLTIGDEPMLRHQIEALLPVRIEPDGAGGRKIVARLRQ